MTEVFISDTKMGVSKAVNEIFSNLIRTEPILKSSKEVYIKVNGIDFKKHAYTSPEVLKEVILYLKDKGAKIYVMENSTQANMTRIVFAINGFKEVCENTGTEIVYLDEEDTETFEFKGKPSAEDKSKGYNLKTFRLPKTVIKIMKNRDSSMGISPTC